MFQITTLDASPKQEIIMVLNDGSRITFTFEYKSNQMGWFFGLKYGDYDYQNMRLCTSYNLLRSYKSYLPFGLRVDTPDMGEPDSITDFISGYASVYLLTAEDVKTVESTYYAKI